MQECQLHLTDFKSFRSICPHYYPRYSHKEQKWIYNCSSEDSVSEKCNEMECPSITLNQM